MMALNSFFNFCLVTGGVLFFLCAFEGYYRHNKKLLIAGIVGIALLLAVYSIGGAFLLYPYSYS